jgi:CYTH domain-containing protein
MRVEVEFESQEEASNFKPSAWMGREITGTEIARDSSLAKMSRDEMLTQIGA